VGYRGYLELARRNDVAKVEARVVLQEDTFEYQYGDEPFLRHKPAEESEEPVSEEEEWARIRYAYAIAWLGNGQRIFEVVSKAQLTKTRNSTQGWKKGGGNWRRWPAQMSRKTPIRRLAKFLPSNNALALAVAQEGRLEAEEQPLETPYEDVKRPTEPDALPQTQTEKLKGKLAQRKEEHQPPAETVSQPASEPPAEAQPEPAPQPSNEEPPVPTSVQEPAQPAPASSSGLFGGQGEQMHAEDLRDAVLSVYGDIASATGMSRKPESVQSLAEGYAGSLGFKPNTLALLNVKQLHRLFAHGIFVFAQLCAAMAKMGLNNDQVEERLANAADKSWGNREWRSLDRMQLGHLLGRIREVLGEVPGK
jgi:recombinational DNA repair protein RecT